MNKLLILCVGLMVGSSAQASQLLLERFFSEVQTLEAAFQQKVVDEVGTTLELSSGRFYLSRPGKFRWDYRSTDADIPLGQQIIADGKSIYMFDPDLEQVTQRSMQNALAQVPSLLLVQNDTELESHFSVSDIGMADGLSWVALKPKDEDASYQQLLIGFLGTQLNSIQLLDGLGNETHLQLSDVESNSKLSAKVFDFQIPEGADLLSE